jgi:hypothetical protein
MYCDTVYNVAKPLWLTVILDANWTLYRLSMTPP